MPQYRDWLRIYADSDSFQGMISCFLNENGHAVDSAPLFENTACYYLYYSDIYLRCYERLDHSQGDRAQPSYWINRLPTKVISIPSYFTRRKNEYQLFALTYALWWGLNDAQIQAIDSTPKSLCLDALNYFLCNPEVTELPQPEILDDLKISPKRFLRRCSDGDPQKESWIIDFDPYAENARRYGLK